MISITPLAAAKIKGIMEEKGEVDAALRIIVVEAGSSGLQYMMTLEHNQNENDHVVHENGVRILVDSQSAPMIEGSQIDYVEGQGLLKTGFTISNPNSQGQGCTCSGGCGCG